MERWRSVFENSVMSVALTDLIGRFLATKPGLPEIGEIQRRGTPGAFSSRHRPCGLPRGQLGLKEGGSAMELRGARPAHTRFRRGGEPWFRSRGYLPFLQSVG